MTGRLRKAIYALFLLAFFITAPTVVLFTAGYRLNFDTLRVVKTGLLLVATTQKGADVFVDATRSAGKTPVLIDDLLPGEHLVRVTRPGTIPWEKRLIIESQRTTFVQDLVLFADAAPASEVAGEIGAFDVSSDGRVVYSMSQAGWVEIWTADADGGNRRLLSRGPETPAVTLALSKDGSFVSVGSVSFISSSVSSTNRSRVPYIAIRSNRYTGRLFSGWAALVASATPSEFSVLLASTI